MGCNSEWAGSLALLATLGGCAERVLIETTTGVRFRCPPFVERSERAVVRACDPQRAREVSALVEELLPRVQELLPYGVDAPRVWCMNEALGTGDRGLFTDSEDGDFIFIGPVPSGELAEIVAHELAHWCSDGHAVQLPIAVEEGLCDAVEERVTRAGKQRRASGSRARIVPARVGREQALRFSRSEWMRLSESARFEARMLGDGIVRELGLQRVAELRERARAVGLDEVPPDWIEAFSPGGLLPRLQGR